MTATEACVRGCSLLRRHLTDCTGDPCRGCLPRRAEHGHLCWPCHRRFQLMLTDAPTVWRWLTGNMTAGDGAARMKQDFERRRGAKGSKDDGVDVPAPVKLDVLDLRDLLADRLACWADDWAEHHNVTAPRHGIDADSEFLLRWLPGLEAVDWIGDWWAELSDTMSQAHAIAPWRPVMRRIPGIDCPECGEASLVIFGGETDVTCLGCRTMIREAHFGLWEQIMASARQAS